MYNPDEDYKIDLRYNREKENPLEKEGKAKIEYLSGYDKELLVVQTTERRDGIKRREKIEIYRLHEVSVGMYEKWEKRDRVKMKRISEEELFKNFQVKDLEANIMSRSEAKEEVKELAENLPIKGDMDEG